MPKMITTVKIEYNHFAEIARKLPVAAFAVIAETLAEIDATVQSGMSAGGGGRTYTRGGIRHTASAPGAMPAKDTGALAASMQHQIIRGKYMGIYYTKMEYAAFLEYGTSQMAARPFMTPAAERARAGFMRKMKSLEDRLR